MRLLAIKTRRGASFMAQVGHVLQVFDKAVHYRQRCAQLMRHVRHEVAPHGFDALSWVMSRLISSRLSRHRDQFDRQHHIVMACRTHHQRLAEIGQLQVIDELRWRTR